MARFREEFDLIPRAAKFGLAGDALGDILTACQLIKRGDSWKIHFETFRLSMICWKRQP